MEVLAAWNFKGFSLSVWEAESEPFAVAESGLGVAEWALFPVEFPASAELVAESGRVGNAPASGRGSCARVREPPSRAELVPLSREFACRREEEASPGLCPEVVDPTAGLRSGLVPGWVFPPLLSWFVVGELGVFSPGWGVGLVPGWVFPPLSL